MKFYMAAGRLVGTQADAKKADPKFVEHDVPTIKEELMGYVNNLLEEIDRAKLPATVIEGEPTTAAQAPAAGVETPAEAPPPRTPLDEAEAKRKMVAMLQSMRVEEIEDKIMESKGSAFARYLLAGIARLGELGAVGWRDFQAQRQVCGEKEADMTGKKGKNLRIAHSDERGLRYLALAQVADLDKAAEPIPALTQP